MNYAEQWNVKCPTPPELLCLVGQPETTQQEASSRKDHILTATAGRTLKTVLRRKPSHAQNEFIPNVSMASTEDDSALGIQSMKMSCLFSFSSYDTDCYTAKAWGVLIPNAKYFWWQTIILH